MKITSNTLVKHGMPFLDLVLRQAEPFMDEMIITLSINADMKTSGVIEKFRKEFESKAKVSYENVLEPKYLTSIRQAQLDESTGDWILFLDDDDYWPTESLTEIVKLLKEDVDAYAVAPYHVVDKKHYEKQWTHMGFTKWFRNQPGVHYEGDWPRDLIYKGEDMLYWKTNPRVKMLGTKFYHLQRIKEYSFRDHLFGGIFKQKESALLEFGKEHRKDLKKIYGYK